MTSGRRARAAPLLLALLLSALAHAVTLSGGWLHLPLHEKRSEPPPLMARLESAQPPVQPEPVRPGPAKRATVVIPAHIATAPVTVRTEAPAPWTSPLLQEPAAETIAPESPVNATQMEAPAAEPVVVATAAPSTTMLEPLVRKTLPRRGRISYNAIFKGFNAGSSELVWDAAGQSYKVDSRTAPEGVARWVSPLESMVFQSIGKLTDEGLAPQRFTSREVRRGVKDEAEAQFDWQSQQIQFSRLVGDNASRSNAALANSSQDIMSMMLQLSLSPPAAGRVVIPVTNGKNFENRELDVLPEVTIDTPIGPLRVLPVKERQRPGSESREIYLAAEYRYLPVRIRFMGRDGSLDGELMVTSIHVE